jgi:RNA polymerase sigma factor (sigma-70 family)
MLGSLTEAEDAVQEAWFRLSKSDSTNIQNLGAWLTTVVARVCLDMLRSRASRREDPLEVPTFEPTAKVTQGSNPEQETLLADSVGLAVLVVLERLAPAERLAFVLHDMFGVAFDEIGEILGRSPEAARQLASRGRRRIQGAELTSAGNVSEQRRVVNAFLDALRDGDFEGLISVLDSDVLVRVDEAAARPGPAREIRGAQTWARGAMAFSHVAQSGWMMLVDGTVGLVWAPQGKLQRVLKFAFENGKIARTEVIADPEHLRKLDLAILDDSPAAEQSAHTAN